MIEEAITKQLLIHQIESIRHAIAEDDALTALNEAQIILSTLKPEYKTKHGLQEVEDTCKHFLRNPMNNRILRLNQRLKQEQDTAIEYYDKDVGQDHRLFYQEKLESDILKAYSQIRKLISTLIKTEIQDDGIQI